MYISVYVNIIYIYKIYYKELVHAIMKAEKFYKLYLANWKPRKADDVCSGLRAREEECPSFNSQEERERILFSSTFFVCSGHNVFKVHLYCIVYQNLIPFEG